MAKLKWNRLSHPSDKRKETGKDEVTFDKGNTEEFPIEETTSEPNRLERESSYPIRQGKVTPHGKPLGIPAYHVRCPWFAQLPIADLKEGEFFDVPFSKFASDPRIANKHHTSTIVEFMRSNLRQFFEKEFSTVNNRLGTRIDKKRKVLTVFRRKDADVIVSAGRAKRVSTGGLRSIKVGRATAKELVNGVTSAVNHRQHYADRRITLTDENIAKMVDLMKDADTTMTAVTNEIIAAFFDQMT
jgi:hypothetical protein